MNTQNSYFSTSISKSDSLCRKIIEVGILVLIVFSPLAKGSVHEWSILVIQLIILLIAAAYILIKEKPQQNEWLTNSFKIPKWLFIGFFAFIIFQIIPLPKFLIKIISPNTFAFHRLFSPDFGDIKFMRISLIPAHTLRQGLELFTYVLLGFLIVKTITKRKQIMRIFSVVIAMGVFEAAYGMFELYNKNPRILFYKKVHGLDAVTGTFVNRNHLSGYLEMIIPLAIGFVIAKSNFFALAGVKWKKKLILISEKGIAAPLLVSLGIAGMALGIIFSKSRSGIFLLLLSFLLFFGLTALYYGKMKHLKTDVRRFVMVLFLFILLISLYLGINATLKRFTSESMLHNIRPIHWGNVVHIIKNYPLFGSGLGTFVSIYPVYEDEINKYQLTHAHNDYLEFISETGILGSTLLFGGILVILAQSFLIWRVRRHPEVKGLALGGIVAIVAILLHSLTDFNLHIPANMLLFTVVLSLTWVTAHHKKKAQN